MLEDSSALKSISDSKELRQTLAVDPAPDGLADFERILDLKPGELVEVRGPAEIMSGLDADGKLDGLPFMPEMLAFCGRRLRVSRRADNTCALGQPRRIEATVHLEQLRCDGSAHRGCDAGCLFLWKEAWLRRAADSVENSSPVTASVESDSTYSLLSELAQKPNNTLMCQATELNAATCPVSLGSPPSYFANFARDYISRKRNFDDLRKL
ncbi:MAG: hypothetical protein WBQ86_18360, partial [Candidatus Binatus sp.]